MPWLLLVVAGLCEVAWAVLLKASDGFTRPWPSLLTVVALAVSMLLLGLAVRSLPVGTAYAVWVGIGAFGAAILGMILFDEPSSAARFLFLGLLLFAIIGLKLTTKPAP